MSVQHLSHIMRMMIIVPVTKKLLVCNNKVQIWEAGAVYFCYDDDDLRELYFKVPKHVKGHFFLHILQSNGKSLESILISFE